MKFTITSITEQGVKAKEDNPFKKPIKPNATNISYEAIEAERNYLNMLGEWQEAEANREEYDVKPSELLKIPDGYVPINGGLEFLVGDEIEGDIINNEIVNVKLI